MSMQWEWHGEFAGLNPPVPHLPRGPAVGSRTKLMKNVGVTPALNVLSYELVLSS